MLHRYQFNELQVDTSKYLKLELFDMGNKITEIQTIKQNPFKLSTSTSEKEQASGQNMLLPPRNVDIWYTDGLRIVKLF